MRLKYIDILEELLLEELLKYITTEGMRTVGREVILLQEAITSLDNYRDFTKKAKSKSASESYIMPQEFRLNPHFDCSLLPTELEDYIHDQKEIEGEFLEILAFGCLRISRFGNKLWRRGSTVSLGRTFTPDYVKAFVERTGIRVTLASDRATASMISLYEAGFLSNVPTRIQLIALARMIKDHKLNLRQALTSVDGAFVKELPVYDSTTKNLAGHIDLLVLDGHVVVWDYKPEWEIKKWSPDPSSDISCNFVQFIPQVAAYALTLMHQLGLQGITCGIYNSEGSWEFDPTIVMRTLNADFNVNFPWEQFSFLNP